MFYPTFFYKQGICHFSREVNVVEYSFFIPVFTKWLLLLLLFFYYHYYLIFPLLCYLNVADCKPCFHPPPHFKYSFISAVDSLLAQGLHAT